MNPRANAIISHKACIKKKISLKSSKKCCADTPFVALTLGLHGTVADFSVNLNGWREASFKK